MFITATLVYYNGQVQHTKGRHTFLDENDFRQHVKNADMIDLKTANHICLDVDSGVAFQVSGYSDNRGMYCDVIA